MSTSKHQQLNSIFHHTAAPLSANAKFFLVAYYLLMQGRSPFLNAKKLSNILSMPYASLLEAVRELESNGLVTLANRPVDKGRPLREIRLVREAKKKLSELGFETVSKAHIFCVPNVTAQSWMHNKLTVKNRLLLVILHVLSNRTGVIEGLTFHQIASLASLKAAGLRSQLNKLEKLGFIFKLIPGIKNTTIFSRRAGIIWLNSEHPLLTWGKDIHNVVIFSAFKTEGPWDGKSVSDLFLCHAQLSQTLDMFSSPPRYASKHKNRVLETSIRTLEELYACSNYETSTAFLQEASSTPELSYFAAYGGLDDLVKVLPESIFSGPRRPSIIDEALRRETSSALTESNPDVAHHLVSSIDLWVTEIINLRIGGSHSENEMLNHAKSTIERFLLCKLNTLGAGEHTEEEIEQEYQHMRTVLGAFIRSLAKDTCKLAEALTGILAKHGINTAQCRINYRACYANEWNKQQKSSIAVYEKLAGIIQIIKPAPSQPSSIKNTLITNTIIQRKDNWYLKDIVVTGSTIEPISEEQRQQISHMLQINHAANKGIVIEALSEDTAS